MCTVQCAAVHVIRLNVFYNIYLGLIEFGVDTLLLANLEYKLHTIQSRYRTFLSYIFGLS